MEYQNVVDQLIEVLTPFAADDILIGEGTELAGELGLDSLQVMDLTLAIEDRFDVSIPVNALADVKTVRDLAVQIEKCVRADR